MPKRPCLDCGALSSGARCPRDEAARRHKHNTRYRPHSTRRPDYTAAERGRRAKAVAGHRAQHGEWCPGWMRPPHMASPANPLTADHIDEVRAGGAEDGPLAVLCRSCNSSKGASRLG